MESFVDCKDVSVKKCEFGFGVFSNRDFVKDEVIETGLMCRVVGVDGNDNPHLFTWSDDRTVWAIASGCIAFYNYSDEPNVVKIGDLVNDTMKIVALRDIKKGEELRNTYMSKKWRKCFQDF